jgi:hexosaminidase
MRKLLFLVLSLVAIMANAQTQPIHLIPQPVDVRLGTGAFALTKNSIIVYDDPALRLVADGLAEKLNTSTGFALKAKQGKLAAVSGIQLSLNKLPNAQLGKEGYSLLVSPKAVMISVNQSGGLYYGIQTLLQLLPTEIESKTVVQRNWSVPAVQITDYPRFGWRGIMLDVSRHFFPKEDVKHYIDDLARMKYNTFHWHLTDDQGWRIEIKSLPRLTSVGAWRVPRIGKFGRLEAPKPGEPATDGGFIRRKISKRLFNMLRNVT